MWTVRSPLAKNGNALAGERLQRRLLDLDEVRPDLAARRAVNAQPRDGAIPVPQKRILRVEAVEAPALERVVFDVAAAALLLAVFLRAARLRRQRREAPVRGEREIDLVAVGIEEARAHDRRFEIVVADDQRHAAEVAERALVQPEKRLELLIPDRFFVAVPRVARASSETPTAVATRPWRRRASARRGRNRLALRRRARSERRRRPGASARSSARTVSPIRSWRRSRTPRPGPARSAAGSDRRRASR